MVGTTSKKRVSLTIYYFQVEITILNNVIMYDYHLKIKLLLFFSWFVYRYVDSWLDKPNTVPLVIPVKRHQTL